MMMMEFAGWAATLMTRATLGCLLLALFVTAVVGLLMYVAWPFSANKSESTKASKKNSKKGAALPLASWALRGVLLGLLAPVRLLAMEGVTDGISSGFFTMINLLVWCLAFPDDALVTLVCNTVTTLVWKPLKAAYDTWIGCVYAMAGAICHYLRRKRITGDVEVTIVIENKTNEKKPKGKYKGKTAANPPLADPKPATESSPSRAASPAPASPNLTNDHVPKPDNPKPEETAKSVAFTMLPTSTSGTRANSPAPPSSSHNPDTSASPASTTVPAIKSTVSSQGPLPAADHSATTIDNTSASTVAHLSSRRGRSVARAAEHNNQKQAKREREAAKAAALKEASTNASPTTAANRKLMSKADRAKERAARKAAQYAPLVLVNVVLAAGVAVAASAPAVEPPANTKDTTTTTTAASSGSSSPRDTSSSGTKETRMSTASDDVRRSDDGNQQANSNDKSPSTRTSTSDASVSTPRLSEAGMVELCGTTPNPLVNTKAAAPVPMPWHRWIDMSTHHWFEARAKDSFIATIVAQLRGTLPAGHPDAMSLAVAKNMLTDYEMRMLAEELSWEEMEELSRPTSMLPCGCQDSWGSHFCKGSYGQQIFCKAKK